MSTSLLGSRLLASVAVSLAAMILSFRAADARLVPVTAPATAELPDLPTLVAAASRGDTLILGPGLYRGTCTLKAGVSLIGASGPDSTILDADGARFVIRAIDVDSTSTIAGLTLQNGRRDTPNSDGGGIYLLRASPVIVNNVFQRHLGYLGAGVFVNVGSRPVIAFNEFRENEGYLGAAVAAYGNCSPLIFNNLMHDNRSVSGGAILCARSTPVILRNSMVGNVAKEDGGGGGIYLESSPALIERNVFASNVGGALFCLDDARPATLRGNVFWRNGGGASRGQCPEFLDVDGNVEADPGLLDPAATGAGRWDTQRVPEVPDWALQQWRNWAPGAAR